MILLLVKAQIKSEIRDKTLLARSLPFVAVVLLLFAFAFDPDRGILERITPGLWWITTTFAAMFLYVRDAHNKKESRFISQFAIEPSTVFISRVLVNVFLTGVVTLVSGVGTFFLFSPDVNNVFQLVIIAILTTFALATIGAIYSPLVSKLHDSGQLLSVVIIPILLPALLASIRATESALDLSASQGWKWSALLTVFVVLYLAVGMLAADSLED